MLHFAIHYLLDPRFVAQPTSDLIVAARKWAKVWTETGQSCRESAKDLINSAELRRTFAGGMFAT
jgi:hypothetical protein